MCSTNIKRVRNLSQNAGKGHFRDSHFQKFWGEHAPSPPRKLALPPPLKVMDPLEIPHAQQFFNLGISDVFSLAYLGYWS